MKKYTILAFMLDRPGVLNKIVLLIRRKMYNIDTLTVCQTNQPDISRMTIALKSDDEPKVLNMLKQIEKITEVTSVELLDPDTSYWREVALIKVLMDSHDWGKLKDEYDFAILHQNRGQAIIQIAGTVDHINDFIAEFEPDEILETARTGITAMKQ